jgi:hypothetical protein
LRPGVISPGLLLYYKTNNDFKRKFFAMKVFEPFERPQYAYPEDMEKILNYLNEHGKINVKNSIIEDFYYDFSEECYCAGWMSISDYILEEFADWLSEKDL